MLSYEFPLLQAMGDTLDLLHTKTRTPTELALYVKRLDVQQLITSLSLGSVEKGAAAMAERMIRPVDFDEQIID